MTYRLLRDPVGIRTPNLLIRSEVLYPVELQSRKTFQKTFETGGKDTNSLQSTKLSRRLFRISTGNPFKGLKHSAERPDLNPAISRFLWATLLDATRFLWCGAGSTPWKRTASLPSRFLGPTNS